MCAPESEAPSAEISGRRISLRAAFSVALAGREAELGVKLRRGVAAPATAALGAGFAPSRSQLVDAITLAPSRKAEPGDETLTKSRRTISLGDLAMVEAHFEMLHHLQAGRLTAYSACLVGRPPPGAADTVQHLPIPADLWIADWVAREDPAGIVPDYAASCLRPYIDVGLGEHVWHTEIEVDDRELLECLSRRHSFESFQGRHSLERLRFDDAHHSPGVDGDADGRSGKFQFLAGKWLVEFGGVRAEVPAFGGMLPINILLSIPNAEVRWDALADAADRVVRRRMSPRPAIDSVMLLGWPGTQHERPMSIRDSSDIKLLEIAVKKSKERALRAAGEQQARLLAKAKDEEKWLRRLCNERRTEKTPFVKTHENIYNQMEYALVRIATACPPFIRHFGLLREGDRQALVIGDRVVKYAPSSEITWELEPLGGWPQRRRPRGET
jgi:hypothetical protein